jgi:DNA-binding NarL/FixJ family response regulator
MTLRIVVADDDQPVRGALRAILESQPDMTVVGEAASGAETVPLVRELRPDVVVMDVRIAQLDGVRTTEQLVTTMPDPPRIVVVTTYQNDAYVYEALRAGASGFLLKRAEAEQLVRAVRLVAAGDCLPFPAAVRELAARHASAERAREVRARLTDRENTVLRLMSTGLTDDEIADEMALGMATVKAQVADVLGKLGARDRTQAVIIAYESGFITPSRPRFET